MGRRLNVALYVHCHVVLSGFIEILINAESFKIIPDTGIFFSYSVDTRMKIGRSPYPRKTKIPVLYTAYHLVRYSRWEGNRPVKAE